MGKTILSGRTAVELQSHRASFPGKSFRLRLFLTYRGILNLFSFNQTEGNLAIADQGNQIFSQHINLTDDRGIFYPRHTFQSDVQFPFIFTG